MIVMRYLYRYLDNIYQFEELMNDLKIGIPSFGHNANFDISNLNIGTLGIPTSFI